MVSSNNEKRIGKIVLVIVAVLIIAALGGRAIYEHWYGARFVSIIDVVDTSDIENGFVSVKVEHNGVSYDGVYTADLNKYPMASNGRYHLEDFKTSDVRFFLLEDPFDPSEDSFTVRRLLRATQ